MKLKFLAIITAIFFISQISFSIYYSIVIVDQNTLINSLQSKLSESQVEHQSLKYKLAQLNSIERISNDPSTTNFLPITNTIDLNE